MQRLMHSNYLFTVLQYLPQIQTKSMLNATYILMLYILCAVVSYTMAYLQVLH